MQPSRRLLSPGRTVSWPSFRGRSPHGHGCPDAHVLPAKGYGYLRCVLTASHSVGTQTGEAAACRQRPREVGHAGIREARDARTAARAPIGSHPLPAPDPALPHMPPAPAAGDGTLPAPGDGRHDGANGGSRRPGLRPSVIGAAARRQRRARGLTTTATRRQRPTERTSPHDRRAGLRRGPQRAILGVHTAPGRPTGRHVPTNKTAGNGPSGATPVSTPCRADATATHPLLQARRRAAPLAHVPPAQQAPRSVTGVTEHFSGTPALAPFPQEVNLICAIAPLTERCRTPPHRVPGPPRNHCFRGPPRHPRTPYAPRPHTR